MAYLGDYSLKFAAKLQQKIELSKYFKQKTLPLCAKNVIL